MRPENRTYNAMERLARALNERPPRMRLSEFRMRVVRRGVAAVDALLGRLVGGPLPKIPAVATISARGDAFHATEEARPDARCDETKVVEPPPTQDNLQTDPPDAQAQAQTQSPSAESVAAQAPTQRPSTEPTPIGIDRVVLVAGASDWVFAYWETAPERIRDATDPIAELRFCDHDGRVVDRARVNPLQGRQRFRVPARDRAYFAELVAAPEAPTSEILSRSREVRPAALSHSRNPPG